MRDALMRVICGRFRQNKNPGLLRGLCSRKVHSAFEGMSIFAAAFRSSHGIGPGTSVVLSRWVRRAAFVGPAARALTCGHAFFMFRFLA